MEEKLKNLFDYQIFAEEPRLAEMIAAVEERFAQELSDDQLSLVSAAGEQNAQPFLSEEEDGDDHG